MKKYEPEKIVLHRIVPYQNNKTRMVRMNFSILVAMVPYSGSLLYNSQSKPNVLCVFCRAPHWSDKCSVITDIEARKTFLRKGGRCFFMS